MEQIFQPALRGNVALIRAWQADTAGNLVYRMTEQNFNRAMATAADLVIVEVEEIVPVGALDPNQIHTPGCFVDYLVQAHTTLDDLGSSASVKDSAKKVDDDRMNMAQAALAELHRGDVVNLGIGIPTLVADLITPEHGIIMHTENGMLGVGPEPEEGGAMDYPVNAGKVPVTALPGSSYFDSADSFAMIRGGHVDVAIMGGLQVDEAANLANWAVPGKPLLGVGGAMDLASGAKKLIITMTHTDRDGSPKILPACTLPLTSRGAVDVVITDLAVFRFVEGKVDPHRADAGGDGGGGQGEDGGGVCGEFGRVKVVVKYGFFTGMCRPVRTRGCELRYFDFLMNWTDCHDLTTNPHCHVVGTAQYFYGYVAVVGEPGGYGGL